MWLSASPPGYPGFNAPRQPGRALATLVVIAVALLIGVGLGGASVFAIVAALTGAPTQEASTQEVGVAGNKTAESKTAESRAVENKSAENKSAENKSAENKSAENKAVENKSAENKAAENLRSAGRVAALPHLSSGAAAGVSATTMTASTPAENLADQPPTRSTPAPTEQALVRPPAQPVKPWPDALSRTHRAEPEPPAAPTSAPPAAAGEAANGENAAGKTADRAISESGRQRPPPSNDFNEADRRWASPSRDGRAGVAPRERDEQRERAEQRERVGSRERDDADGEGSRWRNRDAWRGGLFGLFSRSDNGLGLFGRRGNWRDRSDSWENDRDD